LIISGIAGSTMVSADMAIIPRLLRIASVIHGVELERFSFSIFMEVDMRMRQRNCIWKAYSLKRKHHWLGHTQ
jgi:hypothetical protein